MEITEGQCWLNNQTGYWLTVAVVDGGRVRYVNDAGQLVCTTGRALRHLLTTGPGKWERTFTIPSPGAGACNGP